MRKSFLSMALIICLLFTLFPIPAVAAMEILVDGASYALNAAAPVITSNLSTAQVEYNLNATAAPLTIYAESTDGGTLTYAWYSNTTNSTDGAAPLGVTTPSYTPSTSTVGTTYYFCVVTNTNNDATETQTAQTTSNIAGIRVNTLADPAHELVFDLKTGDITIDSGTGDGTLKIIQNGGETMDNIISSTGITITQTGTEATSSRIIVKADVSGGVNIKLDGVNINATSGSPFEITADAGQVNLILADGSSNRLNSYTNSDYAGLQKKNTSKERDGLLTISCEKVSELNHACNEGCGELTALASSFKVPV